MLTRSLAHHLKSLSESDFTRSSLLNNPNQRQVAMMRIGWQVKKPDAQNVSVDWNRRNLYGPLTQARRSGFNIGQIIVNYDFDGSDYSPGL